ncbi:nuclear transport factor 2 family protein [Flavihumibacter fluvii]|uniref:nuclear transport factor 2 family protein n=1 Tax=Flavihumibacter fluvii TaxID=2838157 RepID=UPI001EFB4770|nr:nuclear transport factor 2 family protein [Flavihumibacter fluvii]ULQ50733.1 nuclear transport factor 2 family protein [Flavihumibacter fluvii]
MKSFVPVFAFLILIVGNAAAQSKEESAVMAATSALNKAMVDGDKTSLESLTATELSYGHSSGKVDNQSQFITALVSGSVDFTSIDITNQTIQVSGKNAIVRNMFSGKLTSDGKPVELKIGILMVWKKYKGNWKLLARQGYKL